MSPAFDTEPAFWARLDLPWAEADRAEGLTELLRRLRVPAAVRHSPFQGGTFAVVPLDGHGAPVALTDTYGPELEWTVLDRDRLISGLNGLAGRGSTLAGERIEQVDVELDDGSLPGDTATAGAVRIDAIAWTTREKRGVLEALGAKFDMSFVAVDAGERGLALTVQDPADRDRAFAEGVWAMTDGVAMWRTGGEASAAFVRRRGAVVMTWMAPWIWVDPSRPAQVDSNGVTVREMLGRLVLDDGDPSAWITRFSLDQESGDRLRALFRRGPHAEALEDLSEILQVHPSLLEVLSDGGESRTDRILITARGARQQFREEMRTVVEGATPGPRSFRGRHPRIWLGVSAVAIIVLSVLAVTGVAAGRPTALLPGLAALVWMASLVIEGLARRSRRNDSPVSAPARGGPDH